MKGPSNPFPEKVRINKLINTRITRTYFPLILVHKSEAYDAFFFFFFFLRKKSRSVVWWQFLSIL